MTPDYDRDNIKLYNDDCMAIMKRYDDNIFDLIITSPPYDNLRTYNDNNFSWNESKWKEVIQEIYRITKSGGVVVWIVGDATIEGTETGTSFSQAMYAKEIGFNLHDTMIYLKDNPPPTGGSNRYYQYFEYMFVFSKGVPKTFNPITGKRRNAHNDKRTHRIKGFVREKDGTFNQKFVKLNEIVKIGNVWKYTVGGGNSGPTGLKHPAVFPWKLATDHLLSWSNEGDEVLDPFMGSGTTGLCCHNHKRHFTGIELDKEYYLEAKNRIISETDQLRLF